MLRDRRRRGVGVVEGLTIGVLSPFVGGDYYGALIASVTEAAAELGTRVVAIQTLDPGSHSADVSGIPDFNRPVGWNYISAFVVVVGAVRREYVQALRQAGKPVVLMSHTMPGLDCPAVVPDNRSGVREAIGHLVVEHGHERVAFVGNFGAPDVRERYAGYEEGLAAHDLRLDPALVFRAADNHETGGEEIAERLIAAGMPATAVVLGTDRNAIGMQRTLHAAGYELPKALALVGFDDITAARYVTPSLSSVRQPLDMLGRIAVNLITAQLRGEEVAPGARYAPTVFINRESCGCGHGATTGELAYDQARTQFADVSYLQNMLDAQYQLGMDLLQTHERDPRELVWLARTPVVAGALGMWTGEPSRDQPLDVVGHLRRDSHVPLCTGTTLPVSEFPPAAVFDVADEAAGNIVFVVPVRSASRDWGMLATVTSIQSKTPPGRELMNQSGALLGVALEQDAMLQSLREQEEQLRRAALYDHLTGMPNRSLFLDRLEQAARRVQRQPEHRVAVLFLDLDGFKAVNDTLGHEAGDQLLIQAGQRISAELRRSDTAARYGGDEFLVLLDGFGDDRIPTDIADRLQVAIDRPFLIGGDHVSISVSIGIAQPGGIAVGGGGPVDVDGLLRDADNAMYRTKSFRKRAASAA